MLADIRAAIPLMGEVEFAILALALVVLTGVGFFVWKKSFQHARVMEDMPTSKVRSAAQGFVELAGVQHPLDATPLLAPLTHHPCTWWSYVIEKKQRSSSSRGAVPDYTERLMRPGEPIYALRWKALGGLLLFYWWRRSARRDADCPFYPMRPS